MDFHAAQVEVLNEFAPVKPAKTKKFQLKADVPGVLFITAAQKPGQNIKAG